MPESTSSSASNDRAMTVDPGLAAGRSRLVLFAGMVLLAGGALLEAGPVVWVGVVVIVGAFVLNTAGKLTHYRSLSVPGPHRLRLSASWLMLALTVSALLVTFAHARYGPGDGGYLLSLAVAGFGFGLLHMAAQSKYLPAEAAENGE